MTNNYEESSCQSEMDLSSTMCQNRAFDDAVYALYLGIPSFLDPEIERIKYADRFIPKNSMVCVINGDKKYVIPACHCDEHEEIQLSLYSFKVKPTKKNIGHSCYDREVTVPAESYSEAKRILEEYLAGRCRSHEIDDSWFMVA